MLLLGILDFFAVIASYLMSLLPNMERPAVSLASSLELMAPALSIFPLDMFNFIFTNGIWWIGIHLAWSVIEWVYKKIPGVS